MLLDKLLQKWRMTKAISQIPQDARVLDIGSEDGYLFEIIGDRISTGVGIDPLLTKTEHHGRYTLVPGHFPEQVPRETPFNAIVMLAVIEHFPEEILQNCDTLCRELLHDDGRVIITVPSKYVDTILTILKWLHLVDADTLDEHHGFEVSMVEEIFSSDSFKLVHREYFQLGLNNLFVFQKI